jgi:molecular chaperone GrpE
LDSDRPDTPEEPRHGAPPSPDSLDDEVAAAYRQMAAASEGGDEGASGGPSFDDLLQQAAGGGRPQEASPQQAPPAESGASDTRDELMEMVRELRGELAEVKERSTGEAVQSLRTERDQLADTVRRLQSDLQAARAQTADSGELQVARAERDRLAEAVKRLESELTDVREKMVDQYDLAEMTLERDEFEKKARRLQEELEAATRSAVDPAELTQVEMKRDEFAEMVKRLQGELETAKREAIDPVVVEKLTTERDTFASRLEKAQEELETLRRESVEPADFDALVADRERLVDVVRNLHTEFDVFRKQTAHLRALARQAGLDAAVDEPELERIPEMDAEPEPPVDAPDPEVVEELARERDEYLESLKRLQAEFENFRKRTARDRAAESNRAGKQLLEDLLPVMDSLGRAVETLGQDGSDKATGVEMVLGQLTGLLRTQNVEPIPIEEGDAFDPELHEAVQALPSDSHEPGTVMAVVQGGYRFSDGTILRPARVVVANDDDASAG